ncbi:hypothetical protein [Caulobacter sp. B11]|uniref:hypothetical protein n=1 Tax=Caulobacter sp. B11 TaxID=2048899 RepID=UPI00117F131E|nr:hypothetical protein [Caulobacter sp. B11]
MKMTLSAILAAAVLFGVTPVAAAPQPSAPALLITADQKLGCAVVFVGFDEVLRRNPGLTEKLAGANDDDGAKAIGPLFKMMGKSGEIALNDSMNAAIAKGEKPSEVLRRGVASMATLMVEAPIKPGQDANEQRGMALFSHCLEVMND